MQAAIKVVLIIQYLLRFFMRDGYLLHLSDIFEATMNTNQLFFFVWLRRLKGVLPYTYRSIHCHYATRVPVGIEATGVPNSM